MNRVFLSGNLTRDPEVRYSQNGMAFARMGIAVQRRVSKNRDAGKDVKDVDFFNIVAFDKTAEFCGKYLTKGSRVFVEGYLQMSSYEKDGIKRTSIDIMVNNIEFGSSKRADSGDGGYRPDDGGYQQRDPRPDDGGYQPRNQRSNDYGDYRPPERENPRPKKPDDEFISDPIDLEDPPF
ncbi:MAG: single-stranded DNA-binding protein [Selenomonadaceae bacterium]|nr:single-stranded DNA-binding protein [Selenomonadaceae bacterium]